MGQRSTSSTSTNRTRSVEGNQRVTRTETVTRTSIPPKAKKAPRPAAGAKKPRA